MTYAPPLTRAQRISKQRERYERVMAVWRALWPDIFTRPVPLAIGVDVEMRRIRHTGGMPGVSSGDIADVLHYWTRSETYLRAIARREMRRNLDGTYDGMPSEEDAHRAAKDLQNRIARRRAVRAQPELASRSTQAVV
jgi:sRNA-binding protein